MDNFLDGSPWGVKMMVYLVSLLLVFLGMLAVPLRWRQWLARTPGLTANCWTLYRVPITLVGGVIWVYYRSFEGFFLIGVGFLLDFWDGFIAKAQASLNDPRSPGVTQLGKVGDPAADKASVNPLFIMMALVMSLFNVVPCIVMSVVELVGTLVRWPFTELKRWPFTAIKARLRRSDATGVGKTKMMLQCATLLMTLPFAKGWIEASTHWMDWVIWGLVVLATASVASRLRLHKAVDESVDSFTRPFNQVNNVFSFILGNGQNAQGNGKVNGKAGPKA
jgi:phosphatidylglycerophosphate synthase